MATIDKDLLLDKIDRLLKLHNYAIEGWFANTIHNTVWDAPEVEGGGDTIYRADAIEAVGRILNGKAYWEDIIDTKVALSALPSAEAVQGWIPCNKQMPDELEAVNITWVNHNPPPYYKHIEDVPLVDSAVYYRSKWYWWDATVIDVLAEYGEDCNAEQIDKDIEILAWMPLPKPYKGDDSE